MDWDEMFPIILIVVLVCTAVTAISIACMAFEHHLTMKRLNYLDRPEAHVILTK